MVGTSGRKKRMRRFAENKLSLLNEFILGKFNTRKVN